MEEIMKKFPRIFTNVLIIVSFLAAFGFAGFSHAAKTETDQEAIYKVINKLEDYYERRKVTKFIDLFSQQKFFNYIAFKEAVEGDFDLYKDIRLKRIDERLYLSENRAIYQAVWEKQYRPSLNAPFERQRGLVRIMLEKFGGKWKIIDLQGYPIFGTSGSLLPDLTVTNVWIMGGGRRLVGVVKNIGPGPAKGFYVGFYAVTTPAGISSPGKLSRGATKETFLGKAFVANLDKGQSKNISWVWIPAPGRRLSDIRVVADVTHKLRELREDNNEGRIPIKPGDTSYCVDLSIDDKGLYVPSSIQPGSPVQVGNNATKAPTGDVKTLKQGDKVRICVEFRNIGGLNATNVPVKVYYITERPDKTVTIFQRAYPQMPSKGKIRFCFFWKVPDLERKPSEKTKRYIRVVLDPDDSLPECSEGNNMTEQEIAIVTKAGGHDGILTATGQIARPDECVHGVDTVNMEVQVEDQDLIGQNRVQVTITTDIGDRETFSLSRVRPGVFYKFGFSGCNIYPDTTLPPQARGDGVLQFNGGGAGRLTIQYVDQVDSQGKTVVRTRIVYY